MTDSVLTRFLTQECDAHVRSLLEGALKAQSRPIHRFELNLFEVTLNHEENSVLIEDVLDASPAGAQVVPLEEFVKVFRAGSAPGA